MDRHAQPGNVAALPLAAPLEADRPSVAGPAVLAVAPARVARGLAVLIATLVALNLVTGLTGWGDRIFVLDTEQSVPAYVATLLLASAAALLALIAALKRGKPNGYRGHWVGLSAVFAYLSLDELVGIHEMMGPRVERWVETGGVFHYASTVFTGALVLIVGLTFLRFFLHLAPRYRALFATAAALYVGGALAMEMVGALVDARIGADNLTYFLVTTLEETMELAGVAVFIRALLGYLSTQFQGAAVRFGPVG